MTDLRVTYRPHCPLTSPCREIAAVPAKAALPYRARLSGGLQQNQTERRIRDVPGRPMKTLSDLSGRAMRGGHRRPQWSRRGPGPPAGRVTSQSSDVGGHPSQIERQHPGPLSPGP
eukprot:762933-Hanusia_phi.AAC.2